MFKFFTKKSSNKKTQKEQSRGTRLGSLLKNKTGQFSDFISQKYDDAWEELSIIREKCKDLRQTNYELGLMHLENGHLSEAIFRFRIIKRFWPNCFDAHYQLAYCLALKEKYPAAKKVLISLLEKDPSSETIARELLNKLNQISQND